MARTRRARGSDTDRPERRVRPRPSLPPAPPSTVSVRQTNGGLSSSRPQRRLRRRRSLPPSSPVPERSYRDGRRRTRRNVAPISSSSSSSSSTSSSSSSSSSSSNVDTGDDDDSDDSNGVNSGRDVDSAAVTLERYCGPDLSERVVMDFIDESNVDNVMRSFECTICFETMLPPVYQCYNGHAVCGLCKFEFERQSVHECPTCRCQLGFFRCIPFEKLATSFRFHCRYRELGCLETFPYGTVEHEMNCKFGVYDCPCPESKCKVSGGIPGLVYHMISVHNCEESTFPFKFVMQFGKPFIIPPCWKPRIYKYMGHHFLFDLATLKDKKRSYMAFLMYLGEKSIAMSFRYTLKIGNNNWKITYKGTPWSVRAGYQTIVDNCDGLVFSRSSISLNAMAGDEPPPLTVAGKISHYKVGFSS